MFLTTRRRALQRGFFVATCLCVAPTAFAAAVTDDPDAAPPGKFLCPPCGCSAHHDNGPDEEFDGPGQCPYCAMVLIAKPAVSQPRPHGASEGGQQSLLAPPPGAR